FLLHQQARCLNVAPAHRRAKPLQHPLLLRIPRYFLHLVHKLSNTPIGDRSVWQYMHVFARGGSGRWQFVHFCTTRVIFPSTTPSRESISAIFTTRSCSVRFVFCFTSSHTAAHTSFSRSRSVSSWL